MEKDINKITNILESLGTKSASLTSEDIEAQYKVFLNMKNNRQVFTSSWNYNNYKLIESNIFMFTTKKISAFALIAVIGITTATYGLDRASAFSLANQISNATNISEYSIDLGYKNVLLNGKKASKEAVENFLKSNENKIQIIGGSTGYKGDALGASKAAVFEISNGSVSSAQPAPNNATFIYEGGVQNVEIASGTVIATAEDFAKTTGISIEESKRIEEDTKKNPYGPGFNEAVKFLELNDGNKVTFVGVDNKNEIVFFVEM